MNIILLKNKDSIIKQIISILLLLITSYSYSQGLNSKTIPLSNFIKRMYFATPFEGVKVIDDYDHQYFISVVSLEKAKYNNSSTMNRVAQVKAQSQANRFFNGSVASTDLVIKTTEQKSNDSTSTVIETLETIKESSLGFTRGLELLINFDDSDLKRMVFIYYREIKDGEK